MQTTPFLHQMVPPEALPKVHLWLQMIILYLYLGLPVNALLSLIM